jgi:hypothetical protein
MFVNLVTPKGGAKNELMPALGVTKFIIVKFGHTLLYCLSLTWMFSKPTSCLLNKCSCLAAALSATKFITSINMN